MFARAYSCVYLNRLRTLVEWPQCQQFYIDLTEDVNDNLREETTTASRQQFPASSSATPDIQPRQTHPGPSDTSHQRTISAADKEEPRASTQQPVRRPDAASKQNSVVEDSSYKKVAATLIQNINKTYAEWSKRKREFQLAVTRSQNNPLSAGSAVEKKLIEQMDLGEVEIDKLKVIDEKYVLNEVISQSEQLEAAKTMQELLKLVKNGQKFKLL